MTKQDKSLKIELALTQGRELLSRVRNDEQAKQALTIISEMASGDLGDCQEVLELYQAALEKRTKFAQRADRARRGTSLFPQRQPTGVSRKQAASKPRCPVRSARRRSLARMSFLPANFSSQFTEGESAALFIIADECAKHGSCSITAKEISDRAGVGLTTARNAYRLAEKLGLLRIIRRKEKGAKNLPNIFYIASLVWEKWLSSPLRKGFKTVKKAMTTESYIYTQYDFLGKMVETNFKKPPKLKAG